MKKKAFTLIEVLLAIFVLEIGLLGIAGFYANSLQITKRARNETIASNLAAGVLDEELAITYDNLPDVPKQRYSPDADNPFYNWYKEVNVTCINTSLNPLACTDPTAHMKKVVVTIYWQESERSFQIATIKAEH